MLEKSVSFSSRKTPEQRQAEIQEYLMSLPPLPREKNKEPQPNLGATLDARRKSGGKQYSH